jgi:hypothetical protein
MITSFSENTDAMDTTVVMVVTSPISTD